MKKISAVILGGVVMAGSAMAETGTSEWTGEAELGLVATSGNTETQTLSAKAKGANERDKWKHEASLEVLNTEDKKVTTAERYTLIGKTNYKLTDLDYVFGMATYEDDRFSGYDWRASEFVGYGRHVIKKEELTLDIEAGLGARQSEDNAGVSTDEGAVRLAGNLGWKISDTSKFTEELTSEIGEDVTISKSVTGLKSQINGSLAMKITYTVKHVSEVPVAVEKVDRETAVTLVYSF